MSIGINKTPNWTDKLILSYHGRYCLYFFFSWMISYSPGQAQVNKSDSLQIAKIISVCQEQLVLKKYNEAISGSKNSLLKSIKLNFKWVVINILMSIAQT